MIEKMSQTTARLASAVGLAQKLVRQPSRGGIDDYGPVLED
ncbi:hypothetical protein [Streptomyces sp. Tu 6176]|nr:hypothetical protein [Streptomyces sp. Tu 6176]